MVLLLLNVGLFAILCSVGCSSQRLHGPIRLFLGLAIAVLTVPAVSYSLYYFHQFDDWLWFYRLRSYWFANFYPGSLGLLAGSLFPSLPNRVSRVAAVAILGPFVVAPFIKPLVLPLHSEQLHERWSGLV